MGKMRETRVEIENVLHREGSPEYIEGILGEERQKTFLGNFIKMMILYDDEMDDATLDYFGTNFSLLYRLLKYVNWDSCKVTAAWDTKITLCGKLKIKPNAYEEHLRSYVSLGLMVRTSLGVYMINPCKLFMGESEEQRRLMIEYFETKRTQENDKKKK